MLYLLTWIIGFILYGGVFWNGFVPHFFTIIEALYLGSEIIGKD